MSMEYGEKTARFLGAVSVEEAEELLEWLCDHPEGEVDLSACEHLHAADLQVLMAARRNILAWPEDGVLAGWLKNALNFSQGD